ncbi:MAG: hypothetical protein ACK4GT_13645 [Pararhodobacter sp.]
MEQTLAAEGAMAELEGRLIAQRRLLARLLLASEPQALEAHLEWLAAGASMRDGQEDPGAVLTGAEVLPLSIAEEFREIAALVAQSR